MQDAERQSTPEPIKPEGAQEPASLAKFIIDLAPLLLFFGTYAKFGIKPATGVLMVATLASLMAARLMFGRVTTMLMVTTGIVLVFGALTFLLDDPSFIKMKPTAVNLLFAGALSVGLWLDRPFLKTMLGQAFNLTEIGWRKLTVRWIGFFVAMAILNELIWRTMSEQAWVNFKVFAIIPLTAVFMIAQMGLLKRHEKPAD